MKPKDYLSEIEHLDSLIQNRLYEKERLFAIATRATTSISELPRSCNQSDRTADIIAKIVDLESEIDRLTDKLIDKRREIIDKLEKLRDIRYYKILYLRYFKYKSLFEIAKEMGYSYDRVRHIHLEALSVFKNFM